MLRKSNGKNTPQGSQDGGTAVLVHGARDAGAGKRANGKTNDGEMHRLSEEIQRLVEASRQELRKWLAEYGVALGSR